MAVAEVVMRPDLSAAQAGEVAFGLIRTGIL